MVVIILPLSQVLYTYPYTNTCYSVNPHTNTCYSVNPCVACVGGLDFELCVFVRHALRSEQPFIIIKQFIVCWALFIIITCPTGWLTPHLLLLE